MYPLHSGNIHGLLQHDDCEWNARDPTDEAYDGEHGKNGENNTGTPQTSVEVVGSGSDGQYAVEDSSNPDKLFSEGTRSEEVGPRKGEGDTQDEGEENDGVGV